MRKILYITLITTLFACETEVNPDLKKAEEIMVVDAWINQKMKRQEIFLSRSQPYFDNTLPSKITGATVRVEDLNSGKVYDFQEGPKSYFWDPVDMPFGEVGHRYRLTVNAEGETFEAYSILGGVPPVDSIKFIYNPNNLLIQEPHFTAEFVATDLVGKGNTYWIKAWKNGVYLGKPSELNIAYDAGLTAGQSMDGQQFIIPIRKDFVNPLDEIPGKEDEFYPPYLVGDSLYVEIHSLGPLAFDFLFGVSSD